MVSVLRVLRVVVTSLTVACALFGMLHYVALLLWGILSHRLLRRQRAATREQALRSARSRTDLPGVSMVLPAFNEEVVIVDSVRAVFAQDYPDLEVIVVSDGSTDRTLGVLVDMFDLEVFEGPHVSGPLLTKPVRAVYRSHTEPRLVVIDKEASGAKADGSNCAVNYSTKPWVAIMDADELVDSRAVLRCMTQVAHTHADENVIAVGVTLLPTNGSTIEDRRVVRSNVSHNPWVGFQTVEYLGAFCVSRPGMSEIGAMPIVSGGFGLFRRDALIRAGGYTHGSLGEDLDMVVRLHRCFREAKERYRVLQVPEAIVWTEFPSSHDVLRRQRIRWHRGLRQVIRAHKGVVGRARYGTFGMLGMLTMYAFEWLAVLVEAFGYVMLAVLLLSGWVVPSSAFAAYVASQALGILIATLAVRTANQYLDVYHGTSNAVRLLGWAILGQFGFRQLTVLWRIRSLFGGSTGWGVMPRVGFANTATS